jgi:hypothetical protein
MHFCLGKTTPTNAAMATMYRVPGYRQCED